MFKKTPTQILQMDQNNLNLSVIFNSHDLNLIIIFRIFNYLSL